MAYQLCILEDNTWLREIYTEFIGKQPDLEVVAAYSTGEEALQKLPSSIELVLVDVSLKGMSGIDFVRTMQKDHPQVKCVLLSGHPSVELAGPAMAIGACAYIEKGDPDSMLSTIYQVLGVAENET